MIYFPDVVLPVLLDAELSALDVWIHLAVADWVDDPSLVIGSFTEASYPGYSSQEAVGWSPASLALGVASSQADPLLYTRTGSSTPQDVYGYYATQGSSGDLLWVAHRDAGPVPMHGPTNQVVVVPRRSLQRC